MISADTIEDAAYQIMTKAGIEIPDDYLGGIQKMANTEEGDLSAFVLKAMLENWEAAKTDRRPMCADTGVPRYYVKYGNEAWVEGGPVELEQRLRRATARATQDVPLRPNRVHPISRRDNDNNVGINAPEIEYSFEPDADWIDVTTVHKGGLFGTDYRMLFPGDGIDGSNPRRSSSRTGVLNRRSSASGSAVRRIPAWCWGSRRRVCVWSAIAIRIRRSRPWSSNFRIWATRSVWARWDSSARPWWSIVMLRSATPTRAVCR